MNKIETMRVRLSIDLSGFHHETACNPCDKADCDKHVAQYRLVTEDGEAHYLCYECISPYLLGNVRSGTVLYESPTKSKVKK